MLKWRRGNDGPWEGSSSSALSTPLLLLLLLLPMSMGCLRTTRELAQAGTPNLLSCPKVQCRGEGRGVALSKVGSGFSLV